MSTIVTRSGKGSPLTHTEVDNNFTNLNTDKLQSGDTAASLTITSADINGGTIDGATIGASSASTGAFTTATASTSFGSPVFKATSSAGGALQNSSGTNQLQWGGGGGNNLSVDVAININPANAQVAISPTGTGSVTINPATSGTINNMSIGASTASTGAFTSLTDSGNLNFTGTGNRITGEMSTLTLANRLAFQTNVANGNTNVNFIPTGTAFACSLNLFGSSDVDNAPRGQLILNSTGLQLSSNQTGTGTNLPIILNTGGSERLRIDTSGNVGIGTSSPSWDVQVQKTGNAFLTLTAGASSTAGVLFGDTSSNAIGRVEYNNGVDAMSFYTTSSERMRIDSSGNLLVGTTSDWFGRKVVGESANNGIAGIVTNDAGFPLSCLNTATSGNNIFAGFWTEARGTPVNRGNIDYNRAAGLTRYNTTSDATLKNLIGDSDKQKSVDILNSTKIREYAWKDDADQKPQIGVIAQELYETYKGAVVEGGEDAEGNYRPWAVDKTAFSFHLVAGWQEHQRIIQEQQTIINDLKARVETLENK